MGVDFLPVPVTEDLPQQQSLVELYQEKIIHRPEPNAVDDVKGVGSKK